MNYLDVKPGDVVVTNFLIYQHWSIVTDKKCSDGKYMLISATKRNATVKEEPWDIVTEGHKTYKIEYERKDSIEEILSKARKQIDIWKYQLIGSNCENFIKSIIEIKGISQVSIASIGVPLTLFFVKTIMKNPTPFKIGLTLIGTAGVLLISNRKTDTKLLTNKT